MGDFSLPHPHVGVAVLLRRQGQLLLLQRINAHGAGTWSVPGGHLEFGESPEECAAREAFEEVGVAVGEIRYLGLTNDVFADEQRHYITLWMEGRILAGEAHIHAPEEAAAVGWFDFQALPENLFLPLKNLLDGHSYPPCLPICGDAG